MLAMATDALIYIHVIGCIGLFALGFAEEVMVLQAHPVFRRVAEVAPELQAVLRGSGDCFHFLLEICVFGVERFLVIELGLEADQEVAGDAEAKLNAEGEVGANSFSLADDVTELGFADFHRFGGFCLGDAVMGDRVADQGGSGV